MNYQFPPEAMPVVEYIRKHVPRPKELPVLRAYEKTHGTALRFPRWDWYTCPMGLLPNAIEALPECSEDLDGFNTDQIEAFYETWDSFTNPIAAVNAVWGEV